MSVYIITGASSDVGCAFLKKLNEKSESIIAICQYCSNRKQLDELCKALKYVKVIPIKCDLQHQNEIDAMISKIQDMELAPTHILHLAASKFEYMRMKEFNWEKVCAELTVQVNSLAQLIKAFVPQMVKSHYGKIAVMLTAYTIGVPPKYMTDYIISKYALLGLIKGVASEYAGKGITINGLSPNMMETKFLSNIDRRMIEINAQQSALKRNLSVEEVTDSLMYLLSDASNCMNGANINLTGGDRM